ncbi:MAG: oligosaccharide flippase family protein [Cyclobacteriaceae bacterium]
MKKLKAMLSANDGFLANVSVSFGLKGGAFLLGLGMNLLLANWLDADGVGQFFLVLTFINVCIVVAKLGLDRTLTRLFTEHYLKQRWAEIVNLRILSDRLMIATSLLIVLIIFFLSRPIAIHVFNQPAIENNLIIFSLAILPIALFQNHGETLKGLKQIRLGLLIGTVALPMLFIVGSIIIHYHVFDVTSAIWIYVISAFLIAIFSKLFYYFKYVEGIKTRIFNSCSEAKKLLGDSYHVLISSLYQQLIIWIPVLTIGYHWDDSQVGTFEIARRVSMLLSFFLIAFNSVFAPKITELYRNGDLDTLQKMYSKSSRYLAILAIVCIIPIIWSRDYIFSLFGANFMEAGIPFIILLVGQFVNCATGSVGFILMMTGNEKLMRQATFFSLLFTGILSVLIIPQWGSLGAAITTSGSIIIMNLVASYKLHKKLGISPLIS